MTTSLITLFDRDLDRLKSEVELIDDKNLWKACSGVTNCAGNLTLHLCGNLKHFIGSVLGQTGYIRERDKEFSDKNISKNDLYKNIEETKRVIKATLTKVSPEDLQSIYPMPRWDQEISVEFFLIHLHSHLNYHLGQINYIRRILTYS
ncbi:DinB family protein [Fulvivirga sp. RKSG066]|uniref:DinB family protein n=1 Tax=Fulvivirga aurantia TaxID=2529383 RepID=UPI0012BB7547|nr:DinB family protein [Fulvivirga aurantia]MTI21927.1 DinB family protein [Fulvivirga aurantia]